MTIVTEPNIEKKVEKPQEKALVVNDGKHGTCPDHTVMDPNEDVEAWLSSAARRRVSAVSTVCVFIIALLIMSMGITGGVYLSRQFSRHWMSRFRRSCETPCEREWLTRNESLTGSQPMFYEGDDDAEWTSENLFEEEFELDLDDEIFEESRVPIIDPFSRVIHDFKTTIIKWILRLCVKPCVLSIHRCVLGTTTAWVLPLPVSVITIPPTIWSIYHHHMNKRDVSAASSNKLQYLEFAGKNTMHYTLIEEEPEERQM
ncbi:uncharacterized protein LOC143020946 isoform X2 [Oratosquilla oratoria]|uniref:uncharacterized protein LOC143020946 isoform X2 n=1 Tax=Oratosquilla oratoria TaxID=337810 RepID=UPI003F7698D4